MERRLCQWGAVLLLGLFFALALSSAVVKSATMDEGGKLALGYGTLKTFELRFQKLHKHPRLAEAWSALPLLLDRRVPDPADVPGWDDPQDYFAYVSNFYYRNPDIVRYTFVGRFQAILLGVLLGAIVFRWARDWFGWSAGLLACFLYAFSPNVLAHSRLITNDIAVALGCVATMYMLQCLLQRPRLGRAALTGLVLGGALLTKYSAVLLLPAVMMMLLAAAWFREWRWATWRDLSRRDALLRTGGLALLIFGLAGVIVWVGYGFELRSPTRMSLPFPVPAASVIDDLFRLQQFSRGKPAFLLGQQYVGGRWTYYFATLLFKTPPVALFLFAVAAVLAFRQRRLAAQMPLWCFPLIFFLFNITGGRNTGHRYLLPMLPFGFIFASQVVPGVRGFLDRRWARVVGAALTLWYAGVSLWIYPDYLAYFNLLAGGPARGYQVLVDSNLDWGQDLIQLRRYMEERELDEVWLSLFSLTDPALYGVRSRRLPDWGEKEIGPDFHYLHPDPGVYVISATLLHGLYMPNPSTFDWFLHREPVDQIGYSMLVYEVEDAPGSPTWLGMCYAPDPPLDAEEVAAGLGRSDLRVVYFDCRAAWVIPGQGGPGWIIVPALEGESSRLSMEWLADARLEFERGDPEGNRVFSLYRIESTPATLPEPGSPVWVTRGETFPDQVTKQAPSVSLPIDLDGPAAFLGYEMDEGVLRPGEAFYVRTFWRAHGPVTDAMPAAFVHLVDASGQTWSIGDALDFPAVQWQDGDIFVQQHTLELPPDMPTGTYWIAGGLYDIVTGSRYPVAGPTDGDTFLFGPLTQ
jgi:4-amino-4-deoxy-L-arabinose transferase-like glycosyltransferase